MPALDNSSQIGDTLSGATNDRDLGERLKDLESRCPEAYAALKEKYGIQKLLAIGRR